MCGKSSDRCVEDSSGVCKLWMGKYWRNANAPIWPCVLMIIVGLGFTWITLDTGLAYCKSSSIVGCICLALNFASNFAIYLPISCLMSKINPIQRRHRFLAVSGAIILYSPFLFVVCFSCDVESCVWHSRKVLVMAALVLYRRLSRIVAVDCRSA